MNGVKLKMVVVVEQSRRRGSEKQKADKSLVLQYIHKICKKQQEMKG
jgi:hypothetical protein